LKNIFTRNYNKLKGKGLATKFLICIITKQGELTTAVTPFRASFNESVERIFPNH